MSQIYPRDTTCYRYVRNFDGSRDRISYRCSAWQRYGRWIVAAVLIFLAFICLIAYMILSRKRKRARMMNMHTQPPLAPPGAGGYGGYAAPPGQYDQQNGGYGQQQYGQQNGGYGQGGGYGQQQYAPPPGAPPPNYGDSGANGGYYGGQQQGGVAPPGGVYSK